MLASKLSALNFTSDTNPNKLEISDEELATNYVNFYEFSTDKRKAVSLAQNFNTQNWKIDISGEIEKPLTLSMEDILKFPLEERIYRFRCVETWSMVVPWVGFELRRLIEMAKPTSEAKLLNYHSFR